MDIIKTLMGPSGFLIIFILLVIVPQFVKIVKEYERGVVFRLGRFAGVRGPGLIILIPMVETMTKVDLRIITMDVPAQEVITRDNVTVKVNAVVYFKVLEPENAIIKVEDYIRATSQYAQTSLRSILGQFELDELLAHRDKINGQLQKIIDEATDSWGIKVTAVELKDVELPQTMQRAMAKQAEAEREKRAKVILAEGEFLAVKKLTEAAQIIEAHPAAMQIRYLQTLSEIGVTNNSTVVFPVPVDTITAFLGMKDPGALREIVINKLIKGMGESGGEQIAG